MTLVDPGSTALLLIGFQRDYFDPDGILYSVVEESHRVSGTLGHTLRVIEAFKDTSMVMVNTKSRSVTSDAGSERARS